MDAGTATEVVALVLFIGTCAVHWKHTCGFVRRGTEVIPASLSGERTRVWFLALLLVSCMLRVATILWLMVYGALDPQNLQKPCVWALMAAVSLLFLSAYTVMILFWAQVYYASRFIVLGRTRFIFGTVTGGSYFVLAALAWAGSIIKCDGNACAGDAVRRAIGVVVGSGFAITGIAFCTYGFRLSTQFSDSLGSNPQRGLIVRRVLLLSLIVPFLLICRAIFEFSVAFGAVIPSPTGSQENMAILLTEWLPALIVLSCFSPPSETKASARIRDLEASLIDSEDFGSKSDDPSYPDSTNQTESSCGGYQVNVGRYNSMYPPDNDPSARIHHQISYHELDDDSRYQHSGEDHRGVPALGTRFGAGDCLTTGKQSKFNEQLYGKSPRSADAAPRNTSIYGSGSKLHPLGAPSRRGSEQALGVPKPTNRIDEESVASTLPVSSHGENHSWSLRTTQSKPLGFAKAQRYLPSTLYPVDL